jgi:hypothetical protein
VLKQLTEFEFDIATALECSLMSQEKVILVLEYC